MAVKFPNVEAELIGRDGNAFFILGTVQRALKGGGATPEQIKEFMDDATSGDYDHLLQTVTAWVNVE